MTSTTAFYFYLIIIICSVIIILVGRLSNDSIITDDKKFKNVLFNDARFFNPNRMVKDEYFLNKKIVELVAPMDASVMQANIEVEEKKQNENSQANNQYVKTNTDDVSRVGDKNIEEQNDKKLFQINKDEEKPSSLSNQANPEEASGRNIFNDQVIDVKDVNIIPNSPDVLRKKENTINENVIITNKDYDYLTPNEAIRLDKRSCKELMVNAWDDNILFCMFKRSLMNPLWMRASLFLLTISFSFGFAAVCYTDYYIDKILYADADTDTYSGGYVLTNEFSRIFSTIVLTLIFIYIIGLFKNPSKISEDKFNKALVTKNAGVIREAHTEYKKAFLCRQIIFIILNIVFHLIAWYYTVAFSVVYKQEEHNWFSGGFIALILNVLFADFILSFIKIGVKLAIRKFECLRCLTCFDHYAYFIRF